MDNPQIMHTTSPEAERVTTGLPGLDAILDNLRIGDNVVWTVDEIDHYRAFVQPFVAAARREGRQIVYFRFAAHPPLLEADEHVATHKLDPLHGFERFTSTVYRHITDHGREAFCVFDSLSHLQSAWATDQMIANFFQVVCPYLYRLDTIAYFALRRGHHSLGTIRQIRQTTQVMVGLYQRGGAQHVHPIKVWQRHSATMFLPHERRGERFVPVANSYDATMLLADVRQLAVDDPKRRLDYWDRLFIDADAASRLPRDDPQHQQMLEALVRVLMGQDARILELARRHMTLPDLLAIGSRMIGTGFIGGKAVGMILGRKILEQDESYGWSAVLEPHDSFYIGSDVYYWYLVHNGWWDLLMQQKTAEGYFSAAEHLERNMLRGRFPDELVETLEQMLEYFGQYPLLVRSSSLLEDGFTGAFAGKYESHFCVNRGTPEQRLDQLLHAMRRIFASTMSRDALTYRRQRGLEDREEPMGLLVQRVSGQYRGHLYMPDAAGVGASYNTFVWSRDMDPRAGMLRIVAGLGTRAVDRVEGDYPCVVALDRPLRRPYRDEEDARKYSQRDMDVLDIDASAFATISLIKLAEMDLGVPDARLAVPDRRLEQMRRDRGQTHEVQRAWLVNFEPLLRDTHFAGLMQRMLKTIERAYGYPVEVEFTLTFGAQDAERISLVQCRPLQTHGPQQRVSLPRQVREEAMLFRTAGRFMGPSVQMPIQRVVWVDPAAYAAATNQQRHDLARLIGAINEAIGVDGWTTLLAGPGRWGTSTPALGVPVRFSQISNFAALVEVSAPEAGIAPELSYGTHFFQDLVEAQTFYAALAPHQEDCQLNSAYLGACPNELTKLVPAAQPYERLIKVCDTVQRGLYLLADVVQQQAMCCEVEGKPEFEVAPAST